MKRQDWSFDDEKDKAQRAANRQTRRAASPTRRTARKSVLQRALSQDIPDHVKQILQDALTSK